MAIFLNTPKLNHWIPKLIQESEKELILVVPYIQTSDNIYESLQTADKNNVEITLIYRENKLSEKEKLKLISLKNLNLLHHPNIHCKCYFNGQLLIVGSMNLYDYSEINNREMGVLIHHTSLNQKGEEDDWSCGDDKALFDDAITEIREIVNGSKIENLRKI